MKNAAFALLLSLASLTGMTQSGETADLPYKRFPTIPPFKILLTDSSTLFSKDQLPSKKATFLILFSPDCDHCKHETEELIKNIDKFKKINIVMATPLPFNKMKEFYVHYNLKRFKNITIGRDIGYVLPTFYGVRTLPYLAFYDKSGHLIDTFEGSLPIEKVLEKFR
jgi:thiol-disulfide isomerase/thioredoxin